MTLQEAKAWLKQKAVDGAQCPCCNQYVRIYKRRINAGMARWLINLYKMPREFQHIASIYKFGRHSVSGTDYTVMKYWDLIQQKVNEDEDKKHSGWWRITDKGEQFVERRTAVLSHAHIYNSRLINFVGDRVTIDQCLGKKFSYQELMGGI